MSGYDNEGFEIQMHTILSYLSISIHTKIGHKKTELWFLVVKQKGYGSKSCPTSSQIHLGDKRMRTITQAKCQGDVKLGIYSPLYNKGS